MFGTLMFGCGFLVCMVIYTLLGESKKAAVDRESDETKFYMELCNNLSRSLINSRKEIYRLRTELNPTAEPVEQSKDTKLFNLYAFLLMLKDVNPQNDDEAFKVHTQIHNVEQQIERLEAGE